LSALVDHVIPGRSADVRLPTERELRQTTIMAIGLDEVSAKVRSGPPKDEEDDYALPIWAGVVPVRTVAGDPEPDPKLDLAIPAPPYVRGLPRPGR